MYRIDDPSAATSLPTPEAAGTEGFWTEGNPATGVQATLERASWFNMIQEELRAVVVASGQTPSKTTYTQLSTAIGTLIAAPRRAVFSSAGSWTSPLDGIVYISACSGGGGGGGGGGSTNATGTGGGGGGGGAGQSIQRQAYAVTKGTTYAISIGAGGAGGAFNSAGAAGTLIGKRQKYEDDVSAATDLAAVTAVVWVD